MSVSSYRDLEVWQRAHNHVLKIYKITSKYPNHEAFGLVQHTRKSSISTASNIVEGKSRGSLGDYIRFLKIALGSLEESRYQVLLGMDLGYLGSPEFESLDSEMSITARKLNSLITALKRKSK